MKIKQKMKNWIVFIAAVVFFFFFYIFFALRLGSNVRSNVSKGAISMASSFLKSEASSIDEKISNLCSDSSSDYVLEDGYLKCSVGNEEEGIELSSLFDSANPLISSVSISLPGKWTWEKGSVSSGDIALSFSLEKTGLEIIYFLSSSYLASSQERGISLVVRNMIYVAILFITFIVGMAIYTFNREPFAENKNKKTIDRILSAVTEDFVFLVVVDVRTRIEKVFFLSNGPRPKWAGKDKTYDENIKEYAEKIVAPEDRTRFLETVEFDSLMNYFKKSGNEVSIEYDVIIDGERRRYQGKFTFSTQDPEGVKIYVGVRDITKIEEERTEYNRKLMSALAEAEEANKGKSYFLFNMSHDIRTPLNAVIGYSELAKKHLDDKKALDDYISKIQICGNQLLGLIGDVLDMAKIESGKIDLSLKPCLCQDLMNEVMVSVNASAKEKRLSFDASGNACHTTILCDKVKVQKILLNILSNAVKYTPGGGKVTLSVHEEIKGDGNLSDFTFVIRDNGIGISKEFLPYVFNSFSRERNATLSGVSGTGLGMTITKRLVDAMGGKIEIESEQGKGTTVTVSLTFKRFENKVIEKKEEKLPEISIEGKRVLLAEDNEINSEIASEMLREVGISTEVVTNGEECVNALLSHSAGYYDLVLMDVQMPVMDGYEATRTIRRFQDKDKRMIPVIAMTANVFEEDKEKAYKSGMNGHLSKPIDMTLLISTLNKCLHL
ncbi:MAG: hybrid sensor histidine kinase/response regulator [Candidatus Ornithospirochaeta sp.]